MENIDSFTLVRRCPFCGKEKEYTIPMSQDSFGLRYKKWQEGMLIQDAFPMLSSDLREVLKTGICSECWDNM